MAIHVLTLPLIGSGATIADAIRPDFGSLKGLWWGQASDKWSSKGRMAVWVECDAADVDTLVKEVGAEVIAEARPVDAAKGDTLEKVYRDAVLSAEVAVVAERDAR